LEKYKDGDIQQINPGLWNTISDYSKKEGTSHPDDLFPLLIYFFKKKKLSKHT
jgi:hypothetical protein